MPVYEEKLISPFAIRFTQDQCRVTFRDGAHVEDTIPSIQVQPGDGKVYDLILRAPFPNIEIIRWSGKRHSRSDGKNFPDSAHWFTFDNRRLYCLQRAAAAYWPRRVAAVVEVLYKADRSSWWRKYDTTTAGRDALLRVSGLDWLPLGRWDWRKAVTESGAKLAEIPDDVVTADDAKSSVDDLMNAPQEEASQSQAAPMAAIQRAMAKLACDDRENPIVSDAEKECSETPSTSIADDTDQDTESSGESLQEDFSAVTAASTQSLLRVSTTALSGTIWHGSKGETYKLEQRGKGSWSVLRNGAGTQKHFSISYDRESNLVWWGKEGLFFLDPSELCEEPDQAKWYAVNDVAKKMPKFQWQRCNEVSSIDSSDDRHQRKQNQTQTQAKGRQGQNQNAGMRWCVKVNN